MQNNCDWIWTLSNPHSCKHNKRLEPDKQSLISSYLLPNISHSNKAISLRMG